MASWTDIPNSSLETGGPARSVDALAFRDNPVAIAEGATGAPKILNAGIANGTIGAEKLQTGATEKNWVTQRYSDVTAGAIGSVCISATFTAKGGTIAGSSLKYLHNRNSGLEKLEYTSLNMAGTWKSLGGSSDYTDYYNGMIHSCLYVRIA